MINLKWYKMFLICLFISVCLLITIHKCKAQNNNSNIYKETTIRYNGNQTIISSRIIKVNENYSYTDYITPNGSTTITNLSYGSPTYKINEVDIKSSDNQVNNLYNNLAIPNNSNSTYSSPIKKSSENFMNNPITNDLKNHPLYHLLNK